MYSQTFLIRASLIRMPRNPNPLPGRLLFSSNPHVSQSEHILMGTILGQDSHDILFNMLLGRCLTCMQGNTCHTYLNT